MEKEEEDLSTDNHKEVPTLTTKNVLTVMDDHLYVSYIHDGIYVPQFHYDGFHTVGPDFDEYILMTMCKNEDEEEND